MRYAEFHGRNTYSYISINGREDDISFFKYRSVNHPSALAPDSQLTFNFYLNQIRGGSSLGVLGHAAVVSSLSPGQTDVRQSVIFSKTCSTSTKCNPTTTTSMTLSFSHKNLKNCLWFTKRSNCWDLVDLKFLYSGQSLVWRRDVLSDARLDMFWSTRLNPETSRPAERSCLTSCSWRWRLVSNFTNTRPTVS